MFKKRPPRPEPPEPREPEPTPDPDKQIALARRAFDAGELEHAAAHTENALFPGPTVTLPEIHEMLARLAGHHQGGSRLFPLNEPYAANRIVARAHVLAHERRFDEALLLLKMAQEFAPEVPWANVPWVTNPDTAAAADPKVVANVALDLMPVLRAAQDLDTLRPAMEPYRVLVRHATSAHPENANLHGAAAYFVRRLDAAEAVGYAERVDQLKPGTASAEVLGLAYRDTGRTDDAIAAFERGVAYDPKLLTMYCSLVDLLFKADRHDEALRYAQRALTVSPGYACGQAAVHAIRFSQTRQASDFDALLKLYKAQRTDPETQGHIGQLLHLASQKSGAETVTISGTPDEVLRQTRKFSR